MKTLFSFFFLESAHNITLQEKLQSYIISVIKHLEARDEMQSVKQAS